MIQSFKNKITEQVFKGFQPRSFPEDLFRRAVIKLDQLHSASSLNDLRIPPSNRLELLSGKQSGRYSIRINGQWRICFSWKAGHAHQVEITDYH